MASPELRSADVDEALSKWRQGDCALGEHWFLFRTNPAYPITKSDFDEETGNTEVPIPGFAVLTQTCDLVRSCEQRPYVQLAPLTELTPQDWRAVERGRSPRYACVPGLAKQRLAADLDRVMTVEKSVVATWERVLGWQSDEDARRFSLALARKRARFAFPDDFVNWVKPLQQRLVDKHDKQNADGQALRSLRELRVRAAPSWDASAVDLIFFFVRDEDDASFDGKRWDEWCDAWLRLLPEHPRFAPVQGVVLTLGDLTARDYVESDPLDLGYLSERAD